MAIDRDALIKALFQDAGATRRRPIPPTMWSWKNSDTYGKYDPEAAKEGARRRRSDLDRPGRRTASVPSRPSSAPRN